MRRLLGAGRPPPLGGAAPAGVPPRPDLVRALNLFYLVGHFVLTAVFFCWLYRRSRPGFALFRNGFLAATAIALVVHWTFRPRRRGSRA